MAALNVSRIGQTNALEQVALQIRKRSDIPDGDVHDVVNTHAQDRGNYVWLQPFFGKVLWIDFLELGEWKTYDSWWLTRHGQIISHDPTTLVDEHVKTYVDPKTRTFELRFYFQSPAGMVYVTNPTRQFYELERDYFARFGLCNPDAKALDVVAIETEMQKQMVRPQLANFVPPHLVSQFLTALSQTGRLMPLDAYQRPPRPDADRIKDMPANRRRSMMERLQDEQAAKKRGGDVNHHRQMKQQHPDDELFWRFMSEYSWVFDPREPGSIRNAFSRAKEYAILMRYSARDRARIARRYSHYIRLVRDRMPDGLFSNLGDDSTSDLIRYIILHGRPTFVAFMQNPSSAKPLADTYDEFSSMVDHIDPETGKLTNLRDMSGATSDREWNKTVAETLQERSLNRQRV